MIDIQGEKYKHSIQTRQNKKQKDILNQEPKKRLDRDLSHLQKFDLESEQSSARCLTKLLLMLKIEPRFAFFAFKKVPP